ncbi:imidazolonepropionase [Proteiniclasticum ruminis]|uniref:Imidazolonepropionase n=1 Tax=Proteiniclasticum ruminis TaxID=398199 RepID=A0A1I4ZNT8_9CLOT|nr:imidazolonepropionase [Proteiniclasticum ruminis]SFN51924.1 imidazolonepropionase [Proteiniclasticum ruminis]
MGEILIKNLASLATNTGNKGKGGKEMGNIVELLHPWVLIKDGIIHKIGGEELQDVAKDPEVLDGSGKTLLPGFVDPHTHLVFGGTREEEFSMRLRGESYMAIMEKGGGIKYSVRKTREASFEELLSQADKTLKNMAELGITTVEAKSGYGLDKETELKQLRVVKKLRETSPIEIVSTFMGAHDIPLEYRGRDREFLDFLADEVLPVVKEENLAEFGDIFTEKNVFTVEDSREYLKKMREAGLKLKIHADEINDLGGAALAAELSLVSADHLLKANEEGLQKMKEAGVIPVLLPLTAFSLKEEFAKARHMIELGLPVAMGTDFNPGSCYSFSVPLMLSLGTLYMGMTPEEALTAVTLNSAAALERADRIGTIEEGKEADLILIDAPSYRFLTYHFGMNLVTTTLKKGKIVYMKQ